VKHKKGDFMKKSINKIVFVALVALILGFAACSNPASGDLGSSAVIDTPSVPAALGNTDPGKTEPGTPVAEMFTVSYYPEEVKFNPSLAPVLTKKYSVGTRLEAWNPDEVLVPHFGRRIMCFEFEKDGSWTPASEIEVTEDMDVIVQPMRLYVRMYAPVSLPLGIAENAEDPSSLPDGRYSNTPNVWTIELVRNFIDTQINDGLETPFFDEPVSIREVEFKIAMALEAKFSGVDALREGIELANSFKEFPDQFEVLRIYTLKDATGLGHPYYVYIKYL
jgi:hypothetical protein